MKEKYELVGYCDDDHDKDGGFDNVYNNPNCQKMIVNAEREALYSLYGICNEYEYEDLSEEYDNQIDDFCEVLNFFKDNEFVDIWWIE